MATLIENAPPVAKSRRRVNQIILLGAVALILNALFNHFVTDASKLNKTLKVGNPFPAFSFTTLGGLPVTEKDFIGKPTVYYFFASWCPCSHQSMTLIKKMYAENGKSGLSMLGVGIQDSSTGLAQFVKLHKIEFPAVTENGPTLAHEAGVEITPTTVFVDETGIIRYAHVGKIERYEQIMEGLDKILKKPAASASLHLHATARTFFPSEDLLIRDAIPFLPLGKGEWREAARGFNLTLDRFFTSLRFVQSDNIAKVMNYAKVSLVKSGFGRQPGLPAGTV
ncbi:MAG: redoxin family protein [Nitrospinae bacterium]|nr:redoxin family protein [Nitrospinota bacterium]